MHQPRGLSFAKAKQNPMGLPPGGHATQVTLVDLGLARYLPERVISVAQVKRLNLLLTITDDGEYRFLRDRGAPDHLDKAT